MKKFIALVLVAMLVLSLAACGGDKTAATTPAANQGVTPNQDNAVTPNQGTAVNPNVPTNPPVVGNDSSVEAYVETNREVLAESMKAMFTANGTAGEVTVEAEGNGIVITILMQGIDNITDAQKAEIQANYDAMKPTLDTMLPAMQTDLPALQYFSYRVCEQDGDLLATLTIGNN